MLDDHTLDPLERVLRGEPDSTLCIAIYRASVHRTGYFHYDRTGTYRIDPIGVIIRSNKKHWFRLSLLAKELGILSFCPWWAILGVEFAALVESIPGRFARSFLGFLQ